MNSEFTTENLKHKWYWSSHGYNIRLSGRGFIDIYLAHLPMDQRKEAIEFIETYFGYKVQYFQPNYIHLPILDLDDIKTIENLDVLLNSLREVFGPGEGDIDD